MLIVATVIKRVTDDGLVELREDVPVGRRYRIETRSRRVIEMVNLEFKKKHRKECVLALQDDGRMRWIPTELLRIED